MTWPCYIENRVIMRRVIMRLNCILFYDMVLTINNKVSFSSITALFDAVEHQDLDAVKEILETNGLDVNRYI